MITEHAILQIRNGDSASFEADFARAQRLISASPGFQRLRLLRCVETADRYVLLVDWDSVEDHEIGFRGSPAYQEWKTLLHHYYRPFPLVEHYQIVAELRP